MAGNGILEGETAGNDLSEGKGAPGNEDVVTPTGKTSRPEPAPVGLLPVAGMATGAVGSAASALYSAAGPWGLAAGAAVAVGAGVAVARKRKGGAEAAARRAMRMGRSPRLPRSGRGGVARSGGVGGSGRGRSGGAPLFGSSRPGGVAGGRRRGPGVAAGDAIRGRRAASGSLGRGSSGGGIGGSGKRGGAATGKPLSSMFGKGSGGKRRGGPASATGRGGLHRTGKRGGTGTGKRGPRVGRDGLTGKERERVRRAHRSTREPRTRAGRLLRRARGRVSMRPAGRGLVRAGRAGYRLGRRVGRLTRVGALWLWAKVSPTAAWVWGWFVLRVRAAWAEMAIWRSLADADDGLLDRFDPMLRESAEEWARNGGGRGAAGDGVIVNLQAQRRIRAAAHELASAIAAYNSEGMLEFVEGLDEIPAALATVADGVRRLAVQSLEEQPLNPGVIEAIDQIATGQSNLANTSMLLGPLARHLHQEDIARLYNQRVNEHKWDQAYNQR
ncbi:hypothetical protein GCM10027294_25970 [Marinactinospora endophytica]